jgi:RNA polymerase-binding protein DksA
VSEVQKTTLTPGKVEFFRHMLAVKINDLLGEAGKTVSEMTSSVKENYPDPNDRASLESDRNFELRIRDRERKLILKMHQLQDEAGKDGKAQGGITARTPATPNGDVLPADPLSLPLCYGEREGFF